MGVKKTLLSSHNIARSVRGGTYMGYRRVGRYSKEMGLLLWQATIWHGMPPVCPKICVCAWWCPCAVTNKPEGSKTVQ